MARCGVTIITGSLGAGKTSVVRSLAEQFGAPRVAVVSNELTKIDHDKPVFERDGLRVVSLVGECGTQRPGALAEAIEHAVELLGPNARSGRVLVELAGAGSTGPMLASLESAGEDRWAIDGVVSVFDARTLLDDRLEVDTEALGAGTIAPGDLIERQVFASTSIALTFADQIPQEQIDQAMRWIDMLNPDASIETTSDGTIRAGAVIDPVWTAPSVESRKPVQVPLRAMVFDARRPMHPARLRDAIEGGSLLGTRSKGTAWLATQNERRVSWDHRGLELQLCPGERWWASTPPASWPGDRRAWGEIFESWNEPWGDRSQSLVIIGAELDRGRTACALEACLLTDQEMAMGPQMWATWEDPLAHVTQLRLAA